MFTVLAGLLFCASKGSAQDTTSLPIKQHKPFISTLRIEARADFNCQHDSIYIASPGSQNAPHADNAYAFQGRYFNLHMGGNLTDKFSYYFRQRIIAGDGSVKFFDHTDFLYLNYQANPNWSLRFGKDALSVGGFEYDAPPIDIFFNGYYWDAFYCFQLGASGAYTSNDGNHTLRLQVANSPYMHTGAVFQSNLLSFNFMWSGNMNHWKTLYSISAFARDQTYGTNPYRHYMGYAVLGNKLEYDKWSAYVDIIARSTTQSEDLQGLTLSAIAEFDYKLNPSWTLFCKGAYTQSKADDEIEVDAMWDCLSLPKQEEKYAGVGFAFRPASCPDVRLHGFLLYYNNNYYDINIANDRQDYSFRANVGVTWNINLLREAERFTSREKK